MSYKKTNSLMEIPKILFEPAVLVFLCVSTADPDYIKML